jgi:hypothetical protein
MLFMNIYTWKPGQRNELLKRRMEKGMALSEGVKLIGEWTDLGGGRGFLLVESNDAKSCMASTMVWSDLMKMEIVPVIVTADLMKVAEKGKGSKK